MKGQAADDYTKIVIGYDGSDNAKRALARAAGLAKATGASLRIIVAVNTIVPMYGTTAPYYPADYADDVIKEGKRLLAEAMNAAKEETKNATGSVLDGHPAEMILDTASREHADLIVLGRRGISGVERFLLGGVSSSVVDHSKCDVLIVK